MKLKGINPIERYVEWIVLTLVVVVLIGFTALQFIGVDEVQVGNNSVPLGRAYQPVENAAAALENQLTDSNPPIPDYTPPTLGAEIDALLADAGKPPEARSLALGSRMPFVDRPDPSDEDNGPRDPSDGFAVGDLTPPAPSSLLAAGYLATIDPREPIRYPGLTTMLPSAQPFDSSGITVEATYDGTALRQVFENDPDGAGPLVAAPNAWWFANTELYAVQAERRERLADGSWSEPQLVGALPGRTNMLAMLDGGDLSPDEARAFAVDNATDIAAPSFYQTIAGPAWASPSEMARLAEVEANRPRIDQLLTDRQTRLDSIAEVRQQLGGGSGGGDGGRDGRNQGQQGGAQEDERTARLRQRIQTLEAEVVQIESRLRALGWSDEASTRGDRPEIEGSLLSDADREIWIHDLSVRPGGVYSYRLRVVINNILRGKGNILAAEDRSRATEVASYGEWSDWTPAVEAPAREYTFLTAARSEEDLLGPGQPGVNAEIYRFYYGYWRRATAEFQPGDLLDLAIDLPSGANLPVFQRSEAAAGGGDSGDDRRGGGGAPPPDQSSDRLQGVTFTPTPGRDSLAVETGLLLLDVAAAEGVERGRLIYLRDASGRIVLRRPEIDRDSPLRRRLERSASTAADQPVPELGSLSRR